MAAREFGLIAAVVAIGAALAYASRGAVVFGDDESMSPVPIDEETGEPDAGELFSSNDDANAGYYDSPLDLEISEMINDDASPELRLQAFLFMIRASEHSFPANVMNDACYFLGYGNQPFLNYADHPVITGELKGVRLPDRMCRAAGFAPGCVSTAAGAYQIIKPTWIKVRAAGTWGPRLPDFSKASQDEAARRILALCGALPYVLSGDFKIAVEKASKQWASLPKSTAQQNPKSWEFAQARYDESLLGFA